MPNKLPFQTGNDGCRQPTLIKALNCTAISFENNMVRGLAKLKREQKSAPSVPENWHDDAFIIIKSYTQLHKQFSLIQITLDRTFSTYKMYFTCFTNVLSYSRYEISSKCKKEVLTVF